MPNDPEDFKKNNGLNNSDNKDDFVGSSFAVQFKPGDKTESVSDKLKESKANLDKGFDPFKKDISDSFKDRFKDEFDDFEFDSSISAFKPFNAPAQTETPAPAEAKTEPFKPAEQPKAPEVKPAAVSNDPVFPKNGGTFDKPAQMPKTEEIAKESVPKFSDSEKKQVKPTDEKFFKSGSGLDFATSEHDKKTSPFMNAAKPDIPAPNEVDIPRAEKPSDKPAVAPAPIPAPFKTPEPAKAETPAARPQPAATGYRPYPSATTGEAFSAPKQEEKTEAKKEDIKTAAPAPFAPATAKSEPVKPAEAPKPFQAVKPAEPAAHTAPAMAKAEPVKPAAPVMPKAEPAKPVAPATAKTEPKPADAVKSAAAVTAATVTAASAVAAKPAPAPAPVKSAEPAKTIVKPAELAKAAAKPADKVKAPAETETPHRPATEAKAKAAKPAPAPAPAPVQNARPGTATPKPAAAPAKADEYSPFEPKNKQPVAATRGVNSNVASHDNKTIQPVNIKKNKKVKEKKSQKDPGLVGLITFLAIIFIAIGVLWALDNTSGFKSLFGKKNVETIVTVTSEEKPVESSKAVESSETETEATTTTTTEATTTTSETTEATTTTTAETTEATTTTTEETATETTTEPTTEATTEETTEETTTTVETTAKKTTSSTVDGYSINDFDMTINNFCPTAGGYKFDITLKNKSYLPASLPKSLYGLDIKLYSDSTITDVTSDAMTFEGDGKTYRGTPNEVLIEGGESYTFTVYVSTTSNVSSYGYSYAYFDWVK